MPAFIFRFNFSDIVFWLVLWIGFDNGYFGLNEHTVITCKSNRRHCINLIGFSFIRRKNKNSTINSNKKKTWRWWWRLLSSFHCNLHIRGDFSVATDNNITHTHINEIRVRCQILWNFFSSLDLFYSEIFTSRMYMWECFRTSMYINSHPI